jgi:hypothetical protein
MTMQVQLHIEDLLYINYTADPDFVRRLVPDQLNLDLITNAEGRQVALLSAVAFRVASLRSNLLPLPPISFNQINYRTYVDGGEGPGVYFFEMRVDSRLVMMATRATQAPISYEKIDLETTPVMDQTPAVNVHESDSDPAPNTLRYAVRSTSEEGLAAEFVVGGNHAQVGPESVAVPREFITERPVGYLSVANKSLFRIEVQHTLMEALSARVEHARVRIFESYGLLNMNEAMLPHSVMYVPEIVMDTGVPTPKR